MCERRAAGSTIRRVNAPRLVALSVVVIVAAACGGDDGDDTTADTEAPVETGVPAETEPPVDEAPVDTEVPVETDAPVGTEAPVETAAPVDTEAPVDEPASIAVGEWTPFDGGEDCQCADGSAVDFMQRDADPEKVVLYFEGGGACFTAETCAFEGQEKTYISSSDQTPEDLAGRGGIFDAENPDNPLGDYSFIYVPYCTGDVHIGNAATDYSEDLTVQHRGYVNGNAALNHLVETYPDVEELVVTGASAGSVPTPLFSGLASDLLPDANIVSFGDSSGAYPDLEALNGAIGSLWGTENAIPEWPETEGIAIEEWSLPGLYTYGGLHAPDVTFAKFDHAYDEVQAFFGGLAGVPGDELLTLIQEIEADVESTGVDVASYIAPGTEHTIVAGDAFYEMEVEGVELVDWFTELVEGGVPADVRCTECEPPAAE